MNNRFPLTDYLCNQNIFENNNFTLLDVGCRQGIAKKWRAFGNNLTAHAIDPIISEIKELKENETNPNVHYHNCFINLADNHPVILSRKGKDFWGNNPWNSLSSVWMGEQLFKNSDSDELKNKQNRWGEIELADKSETYTIDDFIKNNSKQEINFMKIDIDGADLFALLSAEKTLQGKSLLGVELEVNFFGTDCPTDYTYHNTDRLMRSFGYELFDLTIKRYSRRELPAPFIYNIPAHTTTGAPMQGDALYIKNINFIGDDEKKKWLNPLKLLKIASIFELYGLDDCAANILVNYKEVIDEVIDTNELLNRLVPNTDGKEFNYEEYIEDLKIDVTKLYPKSINNKQEN